MIITILNGSPRNEGATAKILKEIADYLTKKSDVNVKYFDLANYSMKFCKGCLQCDYTGKCVISDDGIEDLRNEFLNSDGIVIGSPTYQSSIPGQLKAFFDRAHFAPFEKPFLGKYGFAVVTYSMSGAGLAINQIREVFISNGAAMAGRLSIKLPHNAEPFTRAEDRRRLHEKAGQFYESIKYHKRRSFFEAAYFWIVLFVFKKFCEKNPLKYRRALEIMKQRRP